MFAAFATSEHLFREASVLVYPNQAARYIQLPVLVVEPTCVDATFAVATGFVAVKLAVVHSPTSC